MSTADVTSTGTGAGSPRRSLEASHPHYGEKVIKGFLMLCAALSVAVTLAIIFSLFPPTIDFFREVSVVEFLTGTLWAPAFANASFGVLPIVVGTLMVVVISLSVAIPLGLLSAIYLSEYAPSKVRKTIKPMLEVLEGIPTVAIGLFGFYFLRPFIASITPFLNWNTPFSIGVAGLAVGLLIIPLVASVADDAMRAVPQSLRQGAYALGSSRMQVALKVVLPAAISGVVAAIVLGASRAVGETMVVLIVAGAGNPNLNFNPLRGSSTMTASIAGRATGDIGFQTLAYNTIFSVVAMPFTAALILNMIAIRFVRKYREVYD
ncbi:phosphate ABC transporter permease subunit PstC [soil metagenome]